MNGKPAMSKMGMGMPSPDSMDESSVKKAMSGMSSGSSTNSKQNASSHSGSQVSGKQPKSHSNQKSPLPQKQEESLREVGSVGEETKRSVTDIWQEIKNFFSINSWLGIDPDKLNPEEQAKAKTFHQRYNQLTQEQRAVAKQMYQEEQQKKNMKEEEEKRKKQIKAQQKAQSIQMPSSPQKGAGGKNKKQRAMNKLQQDRTTLGGVQGE